jgi:hypothetical protein
MMMMMSLIILILIVCLMISNSTLYKEIIIKIKMIMKIIMRKNLMGIMKKNKWMMIKLGMLSSMSQMRKKLRMGILLMIRVITVKI